MTSGVIVAGLVMGMSAPARADTIATLAFSGGVFGSGNVISGNLEYSYAPATGFMTSIIAADVTITGSTSSPYYGANEFIYDVPGKTTNSTTSIYNWNVNSNGVNITDTSAAEKLHLAIVGLGNGAVLSLTAPASPVPGTTSISGLSGQSPTNLTVAGTSSASVVPEPASLALLGAATVGLGLLRRRRR